MNRIQKKNQNNNSGQDRTTKEETGSDEKEVAGKKARRKNLAEYRSMSRIL